MLGAGSLKDTTISGSTRAALTRAACGELGGSAATCNSDTVSTGFFEVTALECGSPSFDSAGAFGADALGSAVESFRIGDCRLIEAAGSGSTRTLANVLAAVALLEGSRSALVAVAADAGSTDRPVAPATSAGSALRGRMGVRVAASDARGVGCATTGVGVIALAGVGCPSDLSFEAARFAVCAFIDCTGVVTVDATTVANGFSTVLAAGAVTVELATVADGFCSTARAAGAMTVDVTTVVDGFSAALATGAVTVDFTTVVDGFSAVLAADAVTVAVTPVVAGLSAVFATGVLTVGVAGAVTAEVTTAVDGLSAVLVVGAVTVAVATVVDGFSAVFDAAGAFAACGAAAGEAAVPLGVGVAVTARCVTVTCLVCGSLCVVLGATLLRGATVSASCCKLQRARPSSANNSTTARTRRAHSIMPPSGVKVPTWRGVGCGFQPPSTGAQITSTGTSSAASPCAMRASNAAPRSRAASPASTIRSGASTRATAGP
jgi:hypothetical protein